MSIENIRLGSGTFFINGEPLFYSDESEIAIDNTNTINQKTLRIIKEPVEFTTNCVVDRNTMLSLLYGRKVTNNWLKMHGGVMTRKRK